MHQTIRKTSELLNESLFWFIINHSVRNSTNEEQQERYLINELEKLSPEEIIGFRLRTDKFLADTYNSELWCAGYIMNGGCSDDGFEYFRNWIISRGKETYYKAKENPDTLITHRSKIKNYYMFESFWYVALTAFKNKTGNQLFDFVSEDADPNKQYPKFEFNWDEEKPETMKAICPRLYEKMWR